MIYYNSVVLSKWGKIAFSMNSEQEKSVSKIDSTVKKVTAYVALMTLIFSVLMQAVYLVIGQWDITVLYGNLLGYVTAVGNFLLMGLTVQSAVNKDEKESKKLIRISQALRYLLQIAVVAAGYLICGELRFILAVVIPYLFPSVAVRLMPLIIKSNEE